MYIPSIELGSAERETVSGGTAKEKSKSYQQETTRLRLNFVNENKNLAMTIKNCKNFHQLIHFFAFIIHPCGFASKLTF